MVGLCYISEGSGDKFISCLFQLLESVRIPWLSAPPNTCVTVTCASIVTSPLTLPLSWIRTLVIRLHNPGYSLHLRVFNLNTSSSSLFAMEIPCSQILRIRTWTFLGAIICHLSCYMVLLPNWFRKNGMDFRLKLGLVPAHLQYFLEIQP